MRRTLLPALLALAACALLTAGPAAAEIRIASVEPATGGRVVVTVVTSTPSTRPPVVREDGQRVAGLVAENLSEGKSVVLAIDRSRSMDGRAFADAVAAARTFVAAKRPSDRIAIVAFGSRALQLTRFSSATIDTDSALRTLAVDGREGTALNDAVVLSARALRNEGSAARVVILLTDGRDVSSESTETAATVAAREARAAVYPVAIESAQFSPEPLRRLADATGGTYRGTTSSAGLARAYASIAAELRRTWRLEYLTTARSGDSRELTVWAPGDGSATRNFIMTGAAAGGAGGSLLPAAFYESAAGSLLLAALVSAFVLLALWFVYRSYRGSWLRDRLAPHVNVYTAKQKEQSDRERLAMAADVFRVTERSLGHLRVWQAIGRQIERADLPIRTVELVYMSLGAAGAVALLTAVFGLQLPLVLFVMILAGLAPYGFVTFTARRRVAKFEDQLPDLLMTMAASLKAGHSFKQGMQSVVDEGRPPASEEFRRVLTEMQLGRPMDEALSDAARRVGSANFEFVITAVTIQREVGGSLAGLFDMIADTVRQRQQFGRKLKALTGMGRASAYVLVGLPFFLAAALTLLNGEYMSPLYTTSTGHLMIGSALVSIGIGSLMLKKIVSFKG